MYPSVHIYHQRLRIKPSAPFHTDQFNQSISLNQTDPCQSPSYPCLPLSISNPAKLEYPLNWPQAVPRGRLHQCCERTHRVKALSCNSTLPKTWGHQRRVKLRNSGTQLGDQRAITWIHAGSTQLQSLMIVSPPPCKESLKPLSSTPSRKYTTSTSGDKTLLSTTYLPKSLNQSSCNALPHSNLWSSVATTE